jgi:hypothetical protein
LEELKLEGVIIPKRIESEKTIQQPENQGEGFLKNQFNVITNWFKKKKNVPENKLRI